MYFGIEPIEATASKTTVADWIQWIKHWGGTITEDEAKALVELAEKE